MLSTITTAGLFLINTIFDLFLLVLAVRLILCWAGANYFNPMIQIILKLTNPIVTPIRKIIPNIRNIETSTVIIILVIEIIKYILVGLISIGFPSSVLGLIILSFAEFIKLIINTFFYAILLQAIMTWVRNGNSPISDLLSQVTGRLMKPFQRFIPPIGGIDISPIPALILLQLLIILLVNPLVSIGTVMTFG